MQELSYAMTLQQSGKNLEMLEHILKSCHLGGSKIFYQNADYMLGAAGVVEQLVKVKQVEVKNLYAERRVMFIPIGRVHQYPFGILPPLGPCKTHR
jgi:hypothetical protein